MPRPSRGCGVLYLLSLLELEVCGERRNSILGRYRHLVAAARLVLGRLPVEDELAARGVVAEDRVARHRGLDVVNRRARLTVDAGDLNIAIAADGGQRIGQLGQVRAGALEDLELERHCGATLDRVVDAVHIDWLVEARHGPGPYRVGQGRLTSVTRVVFGRRRDRVGAHSGLVGRRGVGAAGLQARDITIGRAPGRP